MTAEEKAFLEFRDSFPSMVIMADRYNFSAGFRAGLRAAAEYMRKYPNPLFTANQLANGIERMAAEGEGKESDGPEQA